MRQRRRGDGAEAARRWHGFGRCNRANAATKFALALPLLLTIGMFGLEEVNIALIHLRISQCALTLADNASRVGVSNLSTEQLREVDINDVLQGARLQYAKIGLTTYGRITRSSLETNSSGGQWIHWQRCIGLKSGTGYSSSYGAAGNGATGTSFTGMGDPGALVTAPAGSGVMFVEINYDYQPLFTSLLGTRKLHYIASFIVRDNRDFSQVYNPAPAVTPSSCSSYTT